MACHKGFLFLQVDPKKIACTFHNDVNGVAWALFRFAGIERRLYIGLNACFPCTHLSKNGPGNEILFTLAGNIS